MPSTNIGVGSNFLIKNRLCFRHPGTRDNSLNSEAKIDISWRKNAPQQQMLAELHSQSKCLNFMIHLHFMPLYICQTGVKQSE